MDVNDKEHFKLIATIIVLMLCISCKKKTWIYVRHRNLY